MLRSPVTALELARDDADQHLAQLDIYQGLLKDGFTKKQVADFFRQKRQQMRKDVSSHVLPCTFEFASRAFSVADSVSLGASSPTQRCYSSDAALPIVSGQILSGLNQSPKACVPIEVNEIRKTSLLRFQHLSASSDSFEESGIVKMPFTSRSQITYRPRSETQDYVRSVIDSEDSTCTDEGIERILQHLVLDDDLVPCSLEQKTIRRVNSALRPEAPPFTPQFDEGSHTENCSTYLESPQTTLNIPSSPCMLFPARDNGGPAVLLPADHINATPLRKNQPRAHQQFLDGAFSVYNDGMPASTQPQTPTDLHRCRHFDPYASAYTAPLCSFMASASRSVNPRIDIRNFSGHVSPTRQSYHARERRMRERTRAAHVSRTRPREEPNEFLRASGWIGDIQTNPDPDPRHETWRHGHDIDSVGDENFEDTTYLDLSGTSLRSLSGNTFI